MKFSYSLFQPLLFVAAVFAFWGPMQVADTFAQDSAPTQEQAEDALTQAINDILADDSLTDAQKRAAILAAIKSAVESNPAGYAPGLSAAAVRASGASVENGLLADIVFTASLAADGMADAIASAAARAAGDSAASRSTANFASRQAVNAANNAIGQQGSSAGGDAAATTGTSAAAGQLGSNPDLQ